MQAPLRERARGRWQSLLPALGIDARFLQGRKNGPCPMCGGKTRFRFDDKDGLGKWICNCGHGDGFDLAEKVLGLSFREVAERVEAIVCDAPVTAAKPERSSEEKREALNRLWSEARPIEAADPAGLYLANRVGIVRAPRCLRFVKRLRYQDDSPSHHPAMIAMVTGPGGAPATIHRTYLTQDGRKAAVDVPRRLMPGTIPDGAAIRLFPPGETMGIAEGIETAFAAAALFGLPVWAATNAIMLAKWRPPEMAREIVVFGDTDRKFAGQAAAYALARQLANEGLSVRVELPREAGTDWADVWLQRRTDTDASAHAVTALMDHH